MPPRAPQPRDTAPSARWEEAVGQTPVSGSAARLQFWETNRNLLEQGLEIKRPVRISLVTVTKPGKNSVSSPLHTSTNPSQILGSHPDIAQRDIIPQQGMMLWGLTGLPCNLHCGHPGLPFLLPLNCLLLQAEHQRRLNSDLSHFSC